MLDLVGIAHHMPGTKVVTPLKEFGIEEACSGIQSFFLLVFVAVAYSVWLRRPFIRAVLLVIAAVFWSTFMNCLRIFLIPLLFERGIDVSDGVEHDLLGWTTMALGVLLLLSTDQFLMFLFGPVDPGSSSTGPMGRFISKIWNAVLAGNKDTEETKIRRRSRAKPLSQVSNLAAWGAAVLLVIGGLFVIFDVRNAYASATRVGVNFWSGDVSYRIGENALPPMISDWKLISDSYKFSERVRSSDLGEMSESWIYASPDRYYANVSLDQPFPGWHELTKCYRNDGWILETDGRSFKEFQGRSIDGNDEAWNYIEAHFSKPTGEHLMLLFSLFDGFGKPFDPPPRFDSLTNLLHGAKNRMSERARARLFQSDAYQTQLSIHGYNPISKDVRDEATAKFLEIREILRQKLIEAKGRSLGSNSGSVTEPNAGPKAAAE
jgi:exosortase/archaeosortase family protein